MGGIDATCIGGIATSSSSIESSAILSATATGAIEGMELGELAGPLGALLGLALGGLIGFAVKEVRDHFKPSPIPIPDQPKPEPIPYPHTHSKPSIPPFIPLGSTSDVTKQPVSSPTETTTNHSKPYYTHETYHQPPSELPAFPDAKPEKGKTLIGRSRKVRRRWVDRKTKYIRMGLSARHGGEIR